tara:strand:- start:264 stop:1031 length:768 start_codon:yes stop_codon:yes gene_type:complete
MFDHDGKSGAYSHVGGDCPTGRVSRIGPPSVADPDHPFKVQRSHLQKMELGKSRGSSRLSFVTRLHREAVLQEFWCASLEEAEVKKNLAAHPGVLNFKEQFTSVDFVGLDGVESYTKIDIHVLLASGEEVLVSVKYDDKARRESYLAEVANIASQCSQDVADRFVVLSRYSFHPAWQDCAEKIHLARRGWDPEADRIVLEAANDLPPRFTLDRLIEASQLDNRAWRAAVRLIGDGDIRKHPLDRFESDLVCELAA